LFLYQKNKNRVEIKRFLKVLRHKLLAAVRRCYDEYNAKGGAILTLQDKRLVYFPRACIYAIYADYPAAAKCALTVKSCPVCYTKECNMAIAQTWNLVYRNDGDMSYKKSMYKNVIENKDTTAVRRKTARTQARTFGIDLFTSNAFATQAQERHNWIFGPDPDKDSLWQSLPQVTLHGFDEGLCQKLNFAMLEMAVTEGNTRLNMSATEVPSSNT